ncbi:MAG: glycosyltransferase [Chitinophagaceae bacterium]
MKYWLLTTEYPPFYGGGIGTYCVITARMMADEGHDVTVFVSDARVKDFTESREGNVRLVRFNTSRTNSSAHLGHVTNLAYEFAHIVKDFIQKEGKPAIIESQEYLGISYYLLQYKMLVFDWIRDVPIVLTVHSPSFLYLEYNEVNLFTYPIFWICEMEKFCLRAADALISPSEYIISEIGKRFSLAEQHITVIPNPYEARAIGIKEGTNHGAAAGEIIFYGKLSPQKGSFHLLKYFSQLWDEGFDRPLVLIGGQEIIYHPEGLMMGDVVRNRYRKYIDRGLLKLEKPIPPSMMSDRLSGAAVVIIPSYHDNLPYVVFEMMSLGKIVLVSKQGGQAEIVQDGINGFVFDHTIEGSFAAKLRQILNLSEDQRRILGEAAARRVSADYNAAVIFKRKFAIVEMLVKSRVERTMFPVVHPFPVTPQVHGENKSVKGLLSVVIPYYNMGKYIDETITSVRSNRYHPYEIVIVNDGSNEKESLAKLDQYRTQPGITVLDTPNRGLGAARNHGATNAKGQFMAFLDADDTIEPDYYSWSVRVLEKYGNVHFVAAWVQYKEGSTRVWPTFTPEPPLILYHNSVNSSGLVYKRTSFLTGGLNVEDMLYPGLEDYNSVISMVAAGFNGVVLPEILFNYRVRHDSMIRGVSTEKKLNLVNEIVRTHGAIYANFAAEVIGLLNANGPGMQLDNPSLDQPVSAKLPFGIRVSGRLVSMIKRNRALKLIAYRVYKAIKN